MKRAPSASLHELPLPPPPLRNSGASFSLGGEESHGCVVQLGGAKTTDIPPIVLSYIAAASTHSAKLLYCTALVKRRPCIAIFDTGASVSFMSRRFARAAQLKVFSRGQKQVKLANGVVQDCDDIAPMVKVVVGKHTLFQTFHILDMDSDFDLVFGLDFHRNREVQYEWNTGQLSFVCEGERRTLELQQPKPPAVPPSDKGLEFISAVTLGKAVSKGDLVYLVVVKERPQDETDEVAQDRADLSGDGPLPDERVQELLREFSDVVCTALPPGLPRDKGVGHNIVLEPNSTAVWKQMYRLSAKERAELEKQVTELLEKGYIQPSQSPFGAPVLFVPKPDGSHRMCIDYRGLNKITIKNRHALPRIDDLLDTLGKAEVFSSIDLASGYWQVRITGDDVPKTAFRTHIGHFEWLVLPFGLTNAPATFQAAMHATFGPYLNKFVLVYLDDILIFSKRSEHLEHIRLVLQKLREHGWYANAKKCHFNKVSLKFLGHVVTAGKGVSADPAKVAKVQQWSPPTDLNQLRSFLGLANYFRRFIKGFAQVAAPLNNLLSKNTVFSWSAACQQSFEEIKHLLTVAPVLALPVWDKKFQLYTDASDYAIGAVLLQDSHPVAYESRKLNPAETRYSTRERETLAIVHALRHFRPYVRSGVTVYTDHNPLQYLQSQSTLTGRLARWVELLQEYDADIQYVAGSTNKAADALSRCHDYLLVITRRQRIHNIPAPPPPQPSASMPALPAATLPALAPLSPLMQRIVSGYDDDNGMNGILLAQHSVTKDYATGLLMRGSAVVIPDVCTLRLDCLQDVHDSPLAGHPGINKTCERMQQKYWWPGWRKDVLRYVRECHKCQVNKASTQLPAGLLQPLPVPAAPWQDLSMDFVVAFPECEGFDSIYVVVDRFTKMCHLIPCSTTLSAEQCADLFLRDIVRLHGVPKSITADRDVRWTSAFWRTLTQHLQTKLQLSTAFHPQTDGQTERVNRIVQDVLRHYVNAQRNDWVKLLPLVEFAINSSPHSHTKHTPFFLTYGRNPLTPSDIDLRMFDSENPDASAYLRRHRLALDAAKQALTNAVQRYKSYADQKRTDRCFAVGDEVLLSTEHLKIATADGKRKLLPRFVGPFKVLDRVGVVSYRIALPQCMKCHPVFHVSKLKPYSKSVRFQPPPVPQAVDGEFEYEVEAILGHRDRKRGRKIIREYLLKWQGYGPEFNTYEPETNLKNCPDLLQAYNASL